MSDLSATQFATIQCDYLNITLRPFADRAIDLEVVIAVLQTWFGEEYKDGYGFRGYKHSMTFPEAHVIFAWGGDNQRGTAHLSIPGSAASSFSFPLGEVLRVLGRCCVPVITRFDVAIDIPTFDPFWIVQANLREYLLSERVQKWDEIINNHRGNAVGGSIYIGARSSERMLRIYTKQKGENRFTRFELELKEIYAQSAQTMLAEGKTLNQIALSFFMNFFAIARFVDLGDTWVNITRPKRERVRNTVAWLFTVSGSLYDVLDVFGAETLRQIMDYGMRKRGLPPCDNMGVQLELFNAHLTTLENKSIYS